MGKRRLSDIEREFGNSYTESISINMDSGNPCIKEVLDMVGDRNLSQSLRRMLRMN